MIKTEFIIAAVIAAIALVVMLNATATTKDNIGAQERDDQTVSIAGYCGDEACIIDAVRECRLSETRVTDASNATMIISVGEERLYQGRSVCTIGIYEKAGGNIQSWSCKVPVAKLQDSAFADVDELVSKLVSSGHCAVQVP